jgi:hypothetical protein
MPRTAVSASFASGAPAPVADGLTPRQAAIVRLTFTREMPQFRIAQTLRISPSTVRRDLAAALDFLHKTGEDMSADVLLKEGRIRLDITIAYARPGRHPNRPH